MASIQGNVVEYFTRKSVQGAIVRADGATAVTDSAGRFSMAVPLKVISLEVSHPEFHLFVTSLNITAQRAYDVGTIRLQSKVRAL